MANGKGYRRRRVQMVELVTKTRSLVTLDCGHDMEQPRMLHAGMVVYCPRCAKGS